MIAGRYTLEAEIGRGGMGAVWRGRDEVLRRTVALKKIGVAPGGITPDARRAEREAKLAAKLNHANVVAVFDLVEETIDGQSHQWLVMEYVEGTDLSELIRQRGRLSPDEAAPILAQVASALAAAHGAGIVHRDVKPSNILVTPDGQVKLSDFGIARTSTDPALTQTGLVTGSPAYLSPEVASGPAGDARQRRLVVGRHAVPRAGGPPALPGRRQPARRALPDRARGAAALRGGRLAGAGARGDDDARPRAAVADRDGAAVPRGRPGDPAGGRLRGWACGHRPGRRRRGRAAPDPVLRRRGRHPGAAARHHHDRATAGRPRSWGRPRAGRRSRRPWPLSSALSSPS